MATIKYRVIADDYATKKIILKDINGQQKAGCSCCDDWMIIVFSSDGENVGYGLETLLVDEKGQTASGDCSIGSTYMTCKDFDGIYNNFIYEVGKAISEGDWTSSFNIDLYANIDAGDNCYPDFLVDEEGFCLPKNPYSVNVAVLYKGETKQKNYTTYKLSTGSGYAAIKVGVLTIYKESNGVSFELL